MGENEQTHLKFYRKMSKLMEMGNGGKRKDEEYSEIEMGFVRENERQQRNGKKKIYTNIIVIEK